MLTNFKNPLTISGLLLLSLIPIYFYLFFSSPLANKPDMRNPKMAKIFINKYDSYDYAIFKENTYDDVVSIVSNINFEKQGGLSASWGIPNRRNIHQVSLFDNGQCTPKLGEQEKSSPTSMRLGETVALKNLTNNCWYTHYGPLSNWLWYGVYKLGARSVMLQKVFAVALSLLSLILVYFSWRRCFNVHQALFSVALLAVSPFTIDWIKSLNYNSWQNFFLALFIFILLKPFNQSLKLFFLYFILVLQTLNSPEYITLMGSLFLLHIFSSNYKTKEKITLPILSAFLCLSALIFYQYLAFKNSGLTLNEFWNDFSKILFRRRHEFWASQFSSKNFFATLENLVAPVFILSCSAGLMILTKIRWRFFFVFIGANLPLVLFTATTFNHAWIFYKLLFIPLYFSILYLLFKSQEYTRYRFLQYAFSSFALIAVLFLLNNSLGDMSAYYKKYIFSESNSSPQDKVITATEANFWSENPQIDYSQRMTAPIDQGSQEKMYFLPRTRSTVDIFWSENQQGANIIVMKTNSPGDWDAHSKCRLFYLKEGEQFFSAPLQLIERGKNKVAFSTAIKQPFLGLRLTCEPKALLEFSGIEVY